MSTSYATVGSPLKLLVSYSVIVIFVVPCMMHIRPLPQQCFLHLENELGKAYVIALFVHL